MCGGLLGLALAVMYSATGMVTKAAAVVPCQIIARVQGVGDGEYGSERGLVFSHTLPTEHNIYIHV